MEPCVPVPMDPTMLEDLSEKAKDYALMHGICMRRKDAYDRDALHFAPFLLLPSPFPETEFQKALKLQTVLNELMHKVAHDRKFLTETLAQTIKVDEFTGRLFKIFEKVWDEGLAQPTSCGLFRSDYFYCCHTEVVKQVEFNTVASSFGGLSSAGLCNLHKYVLLEMGRKDLVERLPENKALEGLAGAMLECHKIYGERKAAILFIIEDVTYNICDQKFHEFEIRRQNPDVFVLRKTLTEVAERGSLNEATRKLFVDGVEVAMVYFRCGYSPDQYPTEREWDARLMIERSKAIKSPSIHYHLAGTKKVQQELARDGVLERFVKEEDKRKSIRSMFTGLYPLDKSDKGDKAYEMAMKNPSRFVVKPQREGGGNNVYGDDIVPFLEKIRNSSERDAYILMDRIYPPKTTNYMVRPGWKEPKMTEVISELGIFGYIIGDAEKTITNRQTGWMLRTKLSHVDEGGVAAGLGALDSILLVDAEGCCADDDGNPCLPACAPNPDFA